MKKLIALLVLLMASCQPSLQPTQTLIIPTQANQLSVTPNSTATLPAPTVTPTTLSQQPPACTAIGQTWTSPIDGMTQVCVSAGAFLMGSTDTDKSAKANEKPQHTVTLDAFWIDQTIVTNAMYQKCVQAGKCAAPSDKSSATRSNYYDNAKFGSYPVIYVSWDDAQAYCAWAGRSLPTEAQWEKAARGTDGRLYPWGSQAPSCSLANFYRCQGDTSAVGSYLAGASPYGALDMAGNVWQWVADWYSHTHYEYAYRQPSNPTGPASGQYKVLRGGSWGYGNLRTADLNIMDPPGRSSDIGFRCAAPPGK
jgi:formylglycine-generating enzyme required for sulfatase activity